MQGQALRTDGYRNDICCAGYNFITPAIYRLGEAVYPRDGKVSENLGAKKLRNFYRGSF